MKKAVIYCRVSTQKQVIEGDGINSQEKRCTDFAERNGLTVIKCFQDKAISGGADLLDRPAMIELFNFLDTHPTEKFTVIFDDLKRFARSTAIHLKLRQELNSREVILLCPNFKFEDSPEGEFVETIIAAQGQLERQQNKRQVCQKMKARLEDGYWTFYQPPGYHYEISPSHGKLLTPTPKESKLVKEGLELFAKGILECKKDVGEFWDKKGFKPRRTDKWCNASIDRALNQILYVGDIEYIKWGVERRKGRHKAIISIETFEAIQERLNGRAKPRIRVNVNEDFPLRGFVTCSCCGNPITGSWNTGRTKSYANYNCRSPKSKCRLGGKVIHKDIIEEQYLEVLKSAKPKKQILDLTKEVMKDCWNTRIQNLDQEIKNSKQKKNKIEDDKKSATDQYLGASIPSLKDAIAQKIERLDQEYKVVERKIGKLKKTKKRTNFNEALELVFNFLENPEYEWANGDFAQKQLVSKLVFTRPIEFNREDGFGTAEKSLPYSVSEKLNNPKVDLVEVARIELASKEEKNDLLRL